MARRGEAKIVKHTNKILQTVVLKSVGRDSVVSIANPYELDGPGIESRWDKIFRTRPDRPCGPPSFLYSGYQVSFLGVKRQGRGVNHPSPSSAQVKERVELYLYSLSGPSWPVVERTLPFVSLEIRTMHYVKINRF